MKAVVLHHIGGKKEYVNMLIKTHPQNPKFFTIAPTTDKVNFKVVIQDNDGILIPNLVH